jgi:hypothetical protein
MNYHVLIEYTARTEYYSVLDHWLKDRGIVFRETSIMDCTPIGMSFLYSFQSSEDAVAFKVRFGAYCV